MVLGQTPLLQKIELAIGVFYYISEPLRHTTIFDPCFSYRDFSFPTAKILDYPYRANLKDEDRRDRTVTMNRRRTHRPTLEDTYAMGLAYGLFTQIMALDHKPPITLIFLALNSVIFLLPYVPIFFQIPREFEGIYGEALYWTAIRTACLIPGRIVSYSGELYRIVLSTLVHADSLHLVFNMTSFLYKGAVLEAALGSAHLFVVIVYLMISSSVLYVLIAFVAFETAVDPSIMYNCCVGFSGVIFGMKVLVNSDEMYSRHIEDMFNVSIPKQAVWAELILASLSAPQVSFLGHLCGILAGYGYLKFARSVGFMRPRRASRRPQWRYD